MELRRISLCLGVTLLLVISQCSVSDARLTRHRRETDEAEMDETFLGDAAAADDDTQNDDGGNDEDEVPENATILNKPESFTVPIGRSVRLECRVSRDDIVVEWFKDDEGYFMGKGKLAAPDRAYIEPNTTNLVIRDLELSDSGRYRCQLMLEDSSPSIEHTLTVQEAPRIISFHASKTELVEGEDLLLTCNVTGSPKPSITWTKEINGGENYRLKETDGEFSDNTFLMRNVKKEMSGRYNCYAINDLKESAAAYLDVKISSKPRVHVHRTIINSAIGVEALLQCTVLDEEVPSIQWYKDNRRLTSSNKFIINTIGSASNLTVIPKDDNDFGTFTCVGKNRAGEHSRSIEVVQNPVIENLEVEGTKLNWIVHSHQPIEAIELRLRKHGDTDYNEWRVFRIPPPAYNSNRHVYEITHVVEEKLEPAQYEVEIKVKNEKSWSKSTEPKFITIETQAEPIQTASVFLPGGGAAASFTPSMVILSSALTYLLVRTL